MITIKHRFKHRFTGSTLCEFDVATVKEAVVKAASEGADLQGADLQGADLQDADLQGADLQGAYLRGADLQGAYLQGVSIDGEKIEKAPLSIDGLIYWCLITESFMRLGCKRFTHDEWANFGDDEISDMDTGALEFWKQWKDPLLSMCAAHKPVVEEVTA